jgi:hypothetical protein
MGANVFKNAWHRTAYPDGTVHTTTSEADRVKRVIESFVASTIGMGAVVRCQRPRVTSADTFEVVRLPDTSTTARTVASPTH